jgi:hypothetical protein
MESISSSNISEEKEYVEEYLNSNYCNDSKSNSMKVSPSEKKEKRNTFHSQVKIHKNRLI